MKKNSVHERGMKGGGVLLLLLSASDACIHLRVKDLWIILFLVELMKLYAHSAFLLTPVGQLADKIGCPTKTSQSISEKDHTRFCFKGLGFFSEFWPYFCLQACIGESSEQLHNLSLCRHNSNPIHLKINAQKILSDC